MKTIPDRVGKFRQLILLLGLLAASALPAWGEAPEPTPDSREFSGEEFRCVPPGTETSGSTQSSGDVEETTGAFAIHVEDEVGPISTTASGDFFFHDEQTIHIHNVGPSNILLTSSVVTEGQPIGTLVATLHAVNSDSVSNHTFTLAAGEGDADNTTFTITGDALRTASVFHYASNNVYSIRIRVTDDSGSSFEKPFQIEVTESCAPCRGRLYEAWRTPLPSYETLEHLADVSNPPSSWGQTSGPSIVVAPDRAIYVTGVYSENTLVVEKFSPGGTLLWSRDFRDTRTRHFPRSIDLLRTTCDSGGNLVVAARLGGSPIFIKYNGAGAMVWNSRWPQGLPVNNMSPVAILSGPGGATLFCYDTLVLRFDSTGHATWWDLRSMEQTPQLSVNSARVVSASTLLLSGEIDSEGIFIPGIKSISLQSGAVSPVIPVHFDGNEVIAGVMALDSDGNLYALFQDSASESRLSAFSADGTLLWEAHLELDPFLPSRILVDEREVVVYFFHIDTRAYPKVARLHKFSLNGELEWVTEVGPLGDGLFPGGRVVLNENNGVFVIGQRRFSVSTRPQTTTRDALFVQHVNPSGRIGEDRTFWELSLANPETGIHAFASLPDGGVAIAQRQNPDGAADLLVLRPVATRHSVSDLNMEETAWSVGVMTAEPGTEWMLEPNWVFDRLKREPPGEVSYDRFRDDSETIRAAFANPRNLLPGPVFSDEDEGRFLLAPRHIALRVFPPDGPKGRSVLRWTPEQAYKKHFTESYREPQETSTGQIVGSGSDFIDLPFLRMHTHGRHN